MSKNFTINNDFEKILALIEKDKSIINKISVRQLELLNEYLDAKKSYLSGKKGE